MDNVKFIADIGSNHNKSLERCFHLIDTAKQIGCWGVKFQLFKGDQLYQNAPDEIVKNLIIRELPTNWLSMIAGQCRHLGLKFGCSPFYKEAVNILKPYVNFLKISSFDTLRCFLIQKCIDTKIDLMISLGLIEDEEEIKSIVNRCDKDPILFHCVSDYPTKPNETELINIRHIAHEYNIKNIGWSDHTVQPGVIYQAVAYGANFIEFHLDANDNLGWENHAGHCWNAKQMEDVIKNVRIMEESRGNSYGNNFYNINKGKNKRADRATGKRAW